MIKAIIFDCFGVLVTEGWLSFKRRHFSANPERERQATDLRKQADAGLISYRQFVSEISSLAAISEAELSAAIEQNVANDELFAYIEQRLKPRYKIGLLSNAASDRLEDLFGAERGRLFDAVALSFETGAAKPDAVAYQAIAQQLGMNTAECLFIDDQERHVAGARDAGMPAILYQDFDQMRRELEQLLGDPEH